MKRGSLVRLVHPKGIGNAKAGMLGMVVGIDDPVLFDIVSLWEELVDKIGIDSARSEFIAVEWIADFSDAVGPRHGFYHKARFELVRSEKDESDLN